MNNYENIARIKELTSLLNKYRDKYYNYSESLVSDAEYDKLFDEFDEIREQKKEIVKGMSEKVLKLTLEIKELEAEIEKIKKNGV